MGLRDIYTRGRALDATVLTAYTTAASSNVEMLSGLEAMSSLASRATNAGLMYAIFPLAMHEREAARARTGATGIRLALTDGARGFAWTCGILPPIYLGSGEDLKQAAISTLSVAAVAAINAPLGLYIVDVVKEALGRKEPERLPRFLRKAGAAVRVGTVAAYFSLCVAATGYAYLFDVHSQAEMEPPAHVGD